MIQIIMYRCDGQRLLNSLIPSPISTHAPKKFGDKDIIIIIIVYLYFDVYKSCIPITSITSEIGT